LVKAYVLMNCDLGAEREIISALKAIKWIKEIHGTLGLYDIVAQIESDSEEKIRKNITEHIRKIPKIRSTMTLTRSESEEFFQSPEKLIGVILGQNLAQAHVVIHCNRGEEYTTLRNLSHIPEVKEADVVFGFYDVICKIVTPDNQTLENITTKAIRSLPNIESSMTLNIINEQE